MKTTLEIPDALFREAKSAAAQQGIPLRKLVSDALAEKLCKPPKEIRPWMKAFGKLRHLKAENDKIKKRIEEAFEQIEPEQWT